MTTAALNTTTAPTPASVVQKMKGIIAGPSGAGKTTLALTAGEGVFFLSLESGEAALRNVDPPFQGIIRKAATLDAFMDYLVLIFGPRPLAAPDALCSADHYKRVIERLVKATGKASFKEAYPDVKTIWIDSITELSRMALEKANANDLNWTEAGKNGFAIYQEVIDVFLDVQLLIRDQQDYDVVQVALIEPKETEIKIGRVPTKKMLWSLVLDGRKIRSGIFGFADFFFILSKSVQNKKGEPIAKDPAGRPLPVLLTEANIQGLYEGLEPKYRMGELARMEPAHWGRVVEKMRAGKPRTLHVPDTIDEES